MGVVCNVSTFKMGMTKFWIHLMTTLMSIPHARAQPIGHDQAQPTGHARIWYKTKTGLWYSYYSKLRSVFENECSFPSSWFHLIFVAKTSTNFSLFYGLGNQLNSAVLLASQTSWIQLVLFVRKSADINSWSWLKKGWFQFVFLARNQLISACSIG